MIGWKALYRTSAWAALVLLVACERGCRRYPEDIVENFLRACMPRADEAECRCAIGRIQRRYTLEEYRAIEAKIAAGEKLPEEFVQSVADCRR